MHKNGRGVAAIILMAVAAAAIALTAVTWEPVQAAVTTVQPAHQQHQQVPAITLVQSSDDGDDIRPSGFVSMGQQAYSWTGKVHITIVAPDYNFDTGKIDTIGGTEYNTIKIHTRESTIKQYKLSETGANTGIFKGEVTLIGFDHNADGDTQTGSRPGGYDNPQRESGGSGPSNGYLAAGRDDAITVSFEYTEDHTIVGTAPIRWNIGQLEWSESSYAASGTGTVRVIDPDMNWNPESQDRFEINIRSDSDPVGISLAVVETSQSSGIFEKSVSFTASDTSSGHRLRVAEGDVITAEYDDHTLPRPYDISDNLALTATTHIGSLVPPLERVRVSNMMITDGIGSNLGDEISVGQQVQVSSTLLNNQERGQPFVYIVLISDVETGTVTALSWIVGNLLPGQSLNAATSWLVRDPGTYEVSAFVWESIVSPHALAPPSYITLTAN